MVGGVVLYCLYCKSGARQEGGEGETGSPDGHHGRKRAALHASSPFCVPHLGQFMDATGRAVRG